MCASKVMQISKILPALLLSAIVTQAANCMDTSLDKAGAAKSITEVKADLAREIGRKDTEIAELKAKQANNAASTLRFAETMVRVRDRVGAVEAEITAARIALAAGLAESKANHALLEKRVGDFEEYRTQQAAGEAKFSLTLLRARTTTSAIVELAKGVTLVAADAESDRELHAQALRDLGSEIVAIKKHVGMLPKPDAAANSSYN